MTRPGQTISKKIAQARVEREWQEKLLYQKARAFFSLKKQESKVEVLRHLFHLHPALAKAYDEVVNGGLPGSSLGVKIADEPNVPETGDPIAVHMHKQALAHAAQEAKEAEANLQGGVLDAAGFVEVWSRKRSAEAPAGSTPEKQAPHVDERTERLLTDTERRSGQFRKVRLRVTVNVKWCGLSALNSLQLVV